MGQQNAKEKTGSVSSSGILLLCVIALGLLLVGCEGSDGKDGAVGPAGPAGVGVTGPAGPAGVGVRGPTGPTGPSVAGVAGATGATGPAGPLTAGTAAISGTLLKGKISGATVTALGSGTGCTAIGNTVSGTPPTCNLGTANAVVSTTTAADGTYTLQLTTTPLYTGPVILQSVGGSYTNEADGTIELGPAAATPMRAILPTAPTSTVTLTAAITPFTTMAASRSFAQAGTSAVTTLIATQSNTTVESMYGITAIVATTPVDVSQALPAGTTLNAQQYGLLTAAFAQQALLLAIPDPLAFVNAVTTDFGSDGSLDGLSGTNPTTQTGGVAVTPVGTVTALTNLVGSSGLVTAAGIFSTSAAFNVSGVVINATVAAASNLAHATSLATSKLSFTTVNNAITVGDGVNARVQLITSIAGTTATLATVGSLASGTLTVITPFAVVNGTLTSTVPFAFKLCPSTGLASTTCSTTDLRQITVTLSKLTITPSGTTAIVSIPSDSRVNFTGNTITGATVATLATPLLPSTIFTTSATLPNQLTFNPNALITAATASTSAFANLITAGNFAFSMIPGVNSFFRSSGVAVTCLQADTVSNACVSVTLLKGPLQLL